jgi:hypothetical protein
VNPWDTESHPRVVALPSLHICLILFGLIVIPLVLFISERGRNRRRQHSSGRPGSLQSVPLCGIRSTLYRSANAFLWDDYCARLQRTEYVTVENADVPRDEDRGRYQSSGIRQVLAAALHLSHLHRAGPGRNNLSVSESSLLHASSPLMQENLTFK